MTLWHLALQGCLKGNGIDYGCCPDTGGHIKYLLDLAASLAQAQPKLRQVIVTRKFQDHTLGAIFSEIEESLFPGVTLLRIPDNHPGYLPKEKLWRHRESFLASLEPYLTDSRLQPDLIHAHYADAGAIAAEIKQRHQIPYLFTAHSLGLVKERESPDSLGNPADFAARIATEEIAIIYADLIIASSADEAQKQFSLYQNDRPDKVHVVPPGTSFLTDPHSSRRRTALRRNLSRFLSDLTKPTILAIARPVKRKNLSALVDAFASSPWLREHANLVILPGCRHHLKDLPAEQEEELIGLLRQIDDHDLYGSVALPKSHTESDLKNYYQFAKDTGGLFLNPALHEPFGLTLLEATLIGLPCVSTQNGGASDIMRTHQNGLLIDPLSPPEIAATIEKILRQPDLYQALAAAAHRAKPKLDWKVHASRYLQLTKNFLNPPPPASLTTSLERGLICSDIDHTLTGDRAALQDLKDWLVRNPHHQFIISTGRHLDDALEVLDRWEIPYPKIIVSSVGSEIYHLQKDRSYLLDLPWSNSHRVPWKPRDIAPLLLQLPGLTLQEEELQRPRKLGCYLTSKAALDLDRLREELAKKGHLVELVYSHQRFLDILPQNITKGHALLYLQKQLAIPLERTIAAGDSLNDESMLAMAGSAIVVQNGASELRSLRNRQTVFFATQNYAAGVLEGLTTLQSLGWSEFRNTSSKGGSLVS